MIPHQAPVGYRSMQYCMPFTTATALVHLAMLVRALIAARLSATLYPLFGTATSLRYLQEFGQSQGFETPVILIITNISPFKEPWPTGSSVRRRMSSMSAVAR